MLNRDFKEFVGLFNASGVEYLVVGGYALAALVTGIDGASFGACFPSRQIVALGDVGLPIIHIDDFKANKRAAGRPQDIADLESLEPRSDAG